MSAADPPDPLQSSVEAAKAAIRADDVDLLSQLVRREPDLLTWRDPADGSVLLHATTSYANWPGIEEEDTWNRRRCAEVLLDAGAVMDSAVVLRALETGAPKMLEMFERRGLLPQNLRVFAARGQFDRVMRELATFDASEPEAEEHSVCDAFSFAARYEHVDVMRALLARACALDPDLQGRIAADGGVEPFVEFARETAPEAARFALETSRPRSPSPLWQAAIASRVQRALSEHDWSAMRALFDTQPWFLAANNAAAQVRILEIAAYSADTLPFFELFFSCEPEIVGSDEAPESRAVSYALEYGYAEYLPWLTRVWSVPDDLPHAAGRGDAAAVEDWFARHDTESMPRDVLDRAFAWAVQNAEYEIADSLLARGADIDTRWGTHEPAGVLHEVAVAGRFEQVEWLVGRGIDVTRTDPRFGATAAGWAEFAGHERIARYLQKQERRHAKRKN